MHWLQQKKKKKKQFGSQPENATPKPFHKQCV